MNTPDEFNSTIGFRIRELRESLSMSREYFCEKCDLSVSFLCAVENGQKGITAKTLHKICSATNVSADYIINGYEQDYQTDIIIEHLSHIEKEYRPYAVRMLAEFCNAVKEKNKK